MMTEREFSNIKQKLADKKENIVKANAKMEQVLETLKEKFNADNLDKAKEILENMLVELEEKNQIVQTLEDDLIAAMATLEMPA